ncbi:MAG: hypothetical protein DWQ36_24810 [Acidobacteria bacterium]|nr:MAG: hypothetical protein DWQ36_24810 [Acidobacteriota bacterium]
MREGARDPERDVTSRDDEAIELVCDDATAHALELDRLLSLLQGLACTELGRERIAELLPSRRREPARRRGVGDESDRDASGPGAGAKAGTKAGMRLSATQRRALGQLLQPVFDAGELVHELGTPGLGEAGADGPPEPGQAAQRVSRDPLHPLRRGLSRGASALDGPLLVQLALVARAVRVAVRRLRATPEPAPALEELLAHWPQDDGSIASFSETVLRQLDERGEVRDDATPRLRALGQRAQQARRSLYRQFEAYVEAHREDLAEDTLTAREGRLTALLPAGGRGRLQGLHHGRSSTGRSFYFEPLELVDANNEAQEARSEEAAERVRILSELAQTAWQLRHPLRASRELWGTLDELQAIERFRRAVRGCWIESWQAPSEEVPTAVELVQARHPLLDPALRAMRERSLGERGHEGEVVPLDLRLREARVAVVTGPNAGGKTVALKTVGLLSLLHTLGLPVPCEPSSRLPRFRRIVAVVGDEQDMLRDHSTFSARLLRLRQAWEAAEPGSLVLLDEIGSGTSPNEGVALSEPLLERLVERGACAILTTHLVELAARAHEMPGALCAGMEFDPVAQQPRFRLQIGPPSGSQAISLARRLGLPPEWLAAAEERLGDEYRTLIALIAEVESQRDAARCEAERAATLRSDQEKLNQRLAEREEEVRAQARSLRSSLDQRMRELREESRSRLEREVEQLQRRLDEEIERSARGASKRGPVAGRSAIGSAVERVVGPVAEELSRQLAVGTPDPETSSAAPIEVGGTVRHRALGWRGTLESLQGSDAVVSAGGKKLRCKLEELVGETPASAARRVGGSTAEGRFVAGPRRTGGAAGSAATVDLGGQVPSELHLIGQRVEPALERLDEYLDRALLAGHDSVRVVHGHGSGRLREAVRRHLAQHPLALEHGPAAAQEGGNGATRVVLRSGG